MFEHELMAASVRLCSTGSGYQPFIALRQKRFSLHAALSTPQHGDVAKLHANASDTLFWVLNMLVAVQLSCWCQCKILGVLCTATAMYDEQQGLVVVTWIGCSSRYTVCWLDVIALLAGCTFLLAGCPF